ncbi:MAG TPA: hypothetical protein VIJ77_01930 [Candidatus Tumulicola sp.]
MADRNARPTLPIVVSIVWGALLIPGLLGAALSVMFFDAPGSIENPMAWANALIVVSFLCLCIVAIASSWIVWAWKKRAPSRFWKASAIALAGLPLLPVVYVAIALSAEVFGAFASGQSWGVHSTVIHPARSGPSPRPNK